MLQTRAIPCLLLKGRGFVKTTRFRNPKYLGDPINIVRLFNDKEADELIVLDIAATVEKKPPQFEFLANLTSECFMPLCYGGGVRTIEDIRTLLSIGIEKVAINTAAVASSDLVAKAADAFGSQAIVSSIDAKQNWLGAMKVHTNSARKNTGLDPVMVAIEMDKRGAGEILLTSVDRDGSMKGYDLELIRRVSEAVSIPVVACGGAGNMEHFAQAISAGASAVAAGSLFVYVGPHRAVLINYPTTPELRRIFAEHDGKRQ
ncbi:MAG: AglZ/HisF2 family acetamidino modification protein [Gemmatimonadales bacterium]